MFKIHFGSALIVSGFVLASVIPSSTLAQVVRAITGPILPPSPIGILPPSPLPIPPDTQPPLDFGLYTSYSISNAYTYLNWVVCGTTKQAKGCFSSGNLGPFGRIGAMIEGNEAVNRTTGTVTRNVYVVDEASGSGTNVMLYVYQKTDVITATNDAVTVILTNTMSLPLAGGPQAITYLAGNADSLFIGSSQSSFAVVIQKSDLSSIQVSPGSYGNVSSITSNKYGYVSVAKSDDTFGIFAPPGGGDTESGGGNYFMLNTINGVSTGNDNITSTVTKPNFTAHMQIHLMQLTAPNNTK